jgi:hypothetical protein
MLDHHINDGALTPRQGHEQCEGGPSRGPSHRHLFHSKNICPSSSLLQGKHLPFTPSPSSLAKGYDSGPPSLHPWRI